MTEQEEHNQDTPARRRPSLGIVLALVAIALTAGSATAVFTWRSLFPKPPVVEFPELDINGETVPEGIKSPTSPPIKVPNPPPEDSATKPPAESAKTQQSSLYWLDASGNDIKLVPSKLEVPAGKSDAEVLSLAFADLMTGQAAAGTTTGIPANTDLLGLTIEPDGVHVDLSADYIQGGGSASMVGRLAQVVYTATALDPNAPVWISVAGKPLTLLGGEGLEVRQPMTRADLATDFGITEASDSPKQ